MAFEAPQLRLKHSIRGDDSHVESRSADSIIKLHELPSVGVGIHMDMVYSNVAGLGCWSVNSPSGFVASVEPQSSYVLLHWMRSGRIDYHTGPCRTVFSAGSVFTWSSAELHRVEHASDLDIVVTTIRQDDLARFVQVLTGSEHKGRVEFFAVPPDSPNERGLRFVMATLAGAILDDTPLAYAPLAIASLKDMTLGAMIELCPNNIRMPGFVKPSEPVAVARARDFMRANMSRPIRVADIARASGIPLRTLQIAFRRATGESLVEHLRMLRLERARFDLTDPAWSPRVSEVAYRWGFSNLSDFSRRYQQAFGERPRDSLRRKWHA